jgi:hypothetical protein
MWTKIKERERERESKPQTQGCTTWKKKRESKPPKTMGTQKIWTKKNRKKEEIQTLNKNGKQIRA